MWGIELQCLLIENPRDGHLACGAGNLRSTCITNGQIVATNYIEFHKEFQSKRLLSIIYF